MSESSIPSTKSPKYSLAGFTALVVAASLAVVYFRWPFMHAGWPDWFFPLFWAFEIGAILFGIGAIVMPDLPESWLRRIPTVTRNRVLIPREGIGYLLIMVVLFIGSSLTKSNTLLLVFAMMAGPFVVNGWITYTMLTNVLVKRRTPARAMAGELFSVQVDLTNQTPLISIWMMVAQDQVSFGDLSWQPTLLFARVPPQSMQSGHYQIRLMNRGRHHFGPLQVNSRFPLGLIERGSIFREHCEMLIYPRIGRLTPRWKRQLLGASELVESARPRAGAFNDEYHHLREYRIGDSPRDIHWRSSARRSTLIVREYQQNREHQLLLVIDLHQESRADATAKSVTELMLSLAATICIEHRREAKGASLTVVAGGHDQWRWQASSNAGSLETLLDHLAEAEPVADNKFAKVLDDATSHIPSQTRIVVVSPRKESQIPRTSPASNRRASLAMQWLTVTPEHFEELVRFPEEFVPEPTAAPQVSPVGGPR